MIGDYRAALNGAITMLIQSGVPFDFITEINIDEISKYKLVVMPSVTCVSAETASKITDFVKNGGTVIADGELGMFDPVSQKMKSKSVFSELMGAIHKGYIRYHDFDYFSFMGNSNCSDKAEYIPVPFHVFDLATQNDVTVIAKAYAPLAGRYVARPDNPDRPLIVCRKEGKGRIYYISATFFEFYQNYGIREYRQFIYDIIKKLAKPPVSLDKENSGTIEITARKSISGGGVMLVHLLNYSGALTRPIEKNVSLYNVALTFAHKVRTVKSLLSGQKLPVLSQKRVIIPCLNNFDVLIIK